MIVPSSREELYQLALGPDGGPEFTGRVRRRTARRSTEATVTRCRNGIAVNYPEDYMRRRDPDCMRDRRRPAHRQAALPRRVRRGVRPDEDRDPRVARRAGARRRAVQGRRPDVRLPVAGDRPGERRLLRAHPGRPAGLGDVRRARRRSRRARSSTSHRRSGTPRSAAVRSSCTTARPTCTRCSPTTCTRGRAPRRACSRCCSTSASRRAGSPRTPRRCG